jgi:hypothetical protein
MIDNARAGHEVRTVGQLMSAGGQAQRVSLELEADPDAIHGTLEYGEGRRERFWGWPELMAALERVTSTSRDERDRPANDERSRG